MRFWEIAILLLDMAQVAWLVSTPAVPRELRLLAVATGFAAVFQLAWDGFRWQMVPAYVPPAIILGVQLLPEQSLVRFGCALVGLGCVGCAAALSFLLPVFEFPMPTGPYAVATTVLQLIDSSRPEPFASAPNANRELMIQIWYPAAHGGARATYVPRAATDWRTSHLALVRTHATVAVQVSARQPAYPVLVFCPSWNGGKAQNTFETEELASHGFIVVGIDHPFASKFTVFSDGRVVPAKLVGWLDYSSDTALEQSTHTVEQQLRVRSRDVLFVLSELEKRNQHDPAGLFAGRMDLNRLGIFGHSFGGAVAAEVCRLDPRFRAGINMDGMLFGDVADAGVPQPFFFMSDDTPVPEEDLASPNIHRRLLAAVLKRDSIRTRHSLEEYGGYEMVLRGASHMNFSDGPLFCRWKGFTGAGPIAPARAMQIIDRYTLAFFRHHLNGVPEPLLDGPSETFPEAIFRKWPRRE